MKFVGGLQMQATTVQLLLFADYMMLVAEKDEDVENNLRMLEVMEKWKMQMTGMLTVKRARGWYM